MVLKSRESKSAHQCGLRAGERGYHIATMVFSAPEAQLDWFQGYRKGCQKAARKEPGAVGVRIQVLKHKLGLSKKSHGPRPMHPGGRPTRTK